MGPAGFAVTAGIALADAVGAEAGGCTGVELDESGLMPGAPDDAGGRERGGVAGEGDVAELFVFEAEVAVFEPAMGGGAFDAGGKVAPIGVVHRAPGGKGAWSEHVRTAGEKLVARGEDGGKSARSSGLDDGKRGLCGVPEFRGDGGGEFAQGVTGDDQIVRRKGGDLGGVGSEDAGIGQPRARGLEHGRVALEKGDGSGGKELAGGEGSGARSRADVEDIGDGRAGGADLGKYGVGGRISRRHASY